MDKNRRPWPEKARKRIDAAKIITRLQAHVAGVEEMTASQVNAAKILLGKVLPDLKQMEFHGEISSKPAEKMTNDELSTELADLREILRLASGGTEAEAGEVECSSVH